MACSIEIYPEQGYMEILRPDDALRVRIEFTADTGQITLSDVEAAAIVRGVVMLDDEYDVAQARGIAKVLQAKIAAAQEVEATYRNPPYGNL